MFNNILFICYSCLSLPSDGQGAWECNQPKYRSQNHCIPVPGLRSLCTGKGVFSFLPLSSCAVSHFSNSVLTSTRHSLNSIFHTLLRSRKDRFRPTSISLRHCSRLLGPWAKRSKLIRMLLCLCHVTEFWIPSYISAVLVVSGAREKRLITKKQSCSMKALSLMRRTMSPSPHERTWSLTGLMCRSTRRSRPQQQSDLVYRPIFSFSG